MSNDLVDETKKKQEIAAVVVVYNKDIRDISVIESVVRSGSHLLVVDNSDEENSNEMYSRINKIEYVSMRGNKGLSKAYNTAIELLGPVDIIVWLDDDSVLPDEYFEILEDAVNNNKNTDIFVPIVKGQDGIIYSPNNYRFLKNKLTKDPINEVNRTCFNAISSGMAIRRRVFNDYRYNEELFVDEVDHCFCREQRIKGAVFDVIDVVLTQDFHQRGDGLDVNKVWNRERIRIVDIFRHARLIGNCTVVLALVKCCGIGVQFGIKCKSVRLAIRMVCLSANLVFNEL